MEPCNVVRPDSRPDRLLAHQVIGSALTLTKAILLHGGGVDKSQLRFEVLATANREAMLAFLKSL